MFKSMNFNFKFVIKSKHILNQNLIGRVKNLSGLTDELARKRIATFSPYFQRSMHYVVSNFHKFSCFDTLFKAWHSLIELIHQALACSRNNFQVLSSTFSIGVIGDFQVPQVYLLREILCAISFYYGICAITGLGN